MGLLDELKKLTKPYDDEDYLEEDLSDPVRVQTQDNRSYASYAEAPQPQAQPSRRPYVFSRNKNQQAAQGAYQAGYNTYDQGAYAQPQAAYAQQPQPTYGQRQPYAMGGYAQQGAYAQPGYT